MVSTVFLISIKSKIVQEEKTGGSWPVFKLVTQQCTGSPGEGQLNKDHPAFQRSLKILVKKISLKPTCAL